MSRFFIASAYAYPSDLHAATADLDLGQCVGKVGQFRGSWLGKSNQCLDFDVKCSEPERGPSSLCLDECDDSKSSQKFIWCEDGRIMTPDSNKCLSMGVDDIPYEFPMKMSLKCDSAQYDPSILWNYDSETKTVYSRLQRYRGNAFCMDTSGGGRQVVEIWARTNTSTCSEWYIEQDSTSPPVPSPAPPSVPTPGPNLGACVGQVGRFRGTWLDKPNQCLDFNAKCSAPERGASSLCLDECDDSKSSQEFIWCEDGRIMTSDSKQCMSMGVDDIPYEFPMRMTAKCDSAHYDPSILWNYDFQTKTVYSRLQRYRGNAFCMDASGGGRQVVEIWARTNTSSCSTWYIGQDLEVIV